MSRCSCHPVSNCGFNVTCPNCGLLGTKSQVIVLVTHHAMANVDVPFSMCMTFLFGCSGCFISLFDVVFVSAVFFAPVALLSPSCRPVLAHVQQPV